MTMLYLAIYDARGVERLEFGKGDADGVGAVIKGFEQGAETRQTVFLGEIQLVDHAVHDLLEIGQHQRVARSRLNYILQKIHDRSP